MSMTQQEVEFLEIPIIGQPVKATFNNRQIVTSPVADIQTNPNWPDVIWVKTQSGNVYYGRTLFQKTTVLNPNQISEKQQPCQTLPWQSMPMQHSTTKDDIFPDWAIIAALFLFTPIGIYAMWTKCNWLRQVKWAITAFWLVIIWMLMSFNMK